MKHRGGGFSFQRNGDFSTAAEVVPPTNSNPPHLFLYFLKSDVYDVAVMVEDDELLMLWCRQ
ncbi:hypothetical protein Hanom_Chr17g01572981 [Helianthus anomalus]